MPRYAIEALQPGSTWQTIASNNSPAYLEAAHQAGIAHPVGMCLPERGLEERSLAGGRTQSRVAHGTTVTWRGYFQSVVSGRPTEDWKFSQEDVLVSLVWGSQVLQRIAQQVRAAENKLIMTEKLAVLANHYAGTVWPADGLDGGWRNLILAQHHDCWIVPYNGRVGNTWADKVTRWTGETVAASEEIMQQATADLSGGRAAQAAAFVAGFLTRWG